jgi:hypothetical protein
MLLTDNRYEMTSESRQLSKLQMPVDISHESMQMVAEDGDSVSDSSV